MTAKLEAIEAEINELDQTRETMGARFDALRAELADLEQRRSEELIRGAMEKGKGSNGKLQAIRDRIEEVKTELADFDTLAEGLTAKQLDLTLQQRALRLADMTAEFIALAPEVEKLAKQYLDLRAKMGEIVAAYNQAHKRAGQLRTAIQAYRIELATGQADCGDLDGVYHLRFNDMAVGIDLAQLRGERKW